MRQRASVLGVTLFAAMLVGGVAFAQSAGSFAGDFLGPNGVANDGHS